MSPLVEITIQNLLMIFLSTFKITNATPNWFILQSTTWKLSLLLSFSIFIVFMLMHEIKFIQVKSLFLSLYTASFFNMIKSCWKAVLKSVPSVAATVALVIFSHAMLIQLNLITCKLHVIMKISEQDFNAHLQTVKFNFLFYHW